jgi:hypothetical protein
MNSTMIYPELGQSTDAQIQYVCGSYGGLYVRTHLVLAGRGITQTGSGSDAKDGRKSYRVTEKAFEKLEAAYSTCYIANL